MTDWSSDRVASRLTDWLTDKATGRPTIPPRLTDLNDWPTADAGALVIDVYMISIVLHCFLLSFVRLFGSPSVLSFFACSRIRSSFFLYLIHLLVLWFNPPLNKYTSDKQYRRALWVKMSVEFCFLSVMSMPEFKEKVEGKLFEEWKQNCFICKNGSVNKALSSATVLMQYRTDAYRLTAFLLGANYHI